MRLDLFLKWSRVIPRRTLAKEMCDAGRVIVNRSVSRAGREVQIGDTIEIDFPRRWMKARVRSIPPHAPAKDIAKEMVEILEYRKTSSEEEPQ
jgi:ribosomal 50S subunit-recycling heat shock protein